MCVLVWLILHTVLTPRKTISSLWTLNVWHLWSYFQTNMSRIWWKNETSQCVRVEIGCSKVVTQDWQRRHQLLGFFISDETVGAADWASVLSGLCYMRCSSWLDKGTVRLFIATISHHHTAVWADHDRGIAIFSKAQVKPVPLTGWICFAQSHGIKAKTLKHASLLFDFGSCTAWVTPHGVNIFAF